MAALRQVIAVFNELVERLTALLLLNLAFLLLSLPIVTVGASLTAMTALCIQLTEEGRQRQLLRRFWQSFRTALPRSTGPWLILLFGYADIALIVWYCGGVRVLLHPLAMLAVILLLTVLLFAGTWLFALMAGENALGPIAAFRTAWTLAVLQWKKTLQCLSLSLLLVLLTAICPLLLIVLFSAAAYLHCRVLKPALRRYREEGLQWFLNK